MERRRYDPERERIEAFTQGELFGAQKTRDLIERNFPPLPKDMCMAIEERATRETLNPLLQTRITNALDMLMDEEELNNHLKRVRQELKRSISRPDLAALFVESIAAEVEIPAVEELKTLKLDDPRLLSTAINYDIGRGILYITSRILDAGTLIRGNFDQRLDEIRSTGGGFTPLHQESVIRELTSRAKRNTQALELDPTGKSLVEILVEDAKGINDGGPNRNEFGLYGAKFAENAYNVMYPLALRMIKPT